MRAMRIGMFEAARALDVPDGAAGRDDASAAGRDTRASEAALAAPNRAEEVAALSRSVRAATRLALGAIRVGLLAVPLPAAAVVGPSRDAVAEVAAEAVMVLQRRGSEAGFCTGVVLGPRAVLTAAHCVPAGADLRVHFKGEDGAPVLLPVARVRRHPGYRADAVAKRERSVDLAVVTLAEPLPGRFHPAMLSAESSAAVGQPFTLAGYGLAREGEAASSGRLRAAALAARAPLSAVLLWLDDPARAGAGACTGDSGGPVLDRAGAVAALALWSAGDGARHCGALTQALWLAPYRDWIADASAP